VHSVRENLVQAGYIVVICQDVFMVALVFGINDGQQNGRIGMVMP